MTFVAALIISAVLCYALAPVLKKAPWLFYGLSIAVVAVAFAGMADVLDGSWWKPLILLVRRCMLAFALFAVVMFIGVLPRSSKTALRMRSVRAEISIIACILCAGHMAVYAAPYVRRTFSGILNANMLLAMAIAVSLLVLVVVLGATSFKSVKRRMKAANWKALQRFAYLFFGLAYLHLICILLPSAVAGSQTAQVNVAIYSVVFMGYLVGRLWRWRADAAAAKAKGLLESEASRRLVQEDFDLQTA